MTLARPHPSATVARGAWLALVLALLSVATSFQAFAADPPFPALTGRVVDAANIIPAEARARIEGKLKAYEDKTSDQVVVATVPTLGELPIEGYANKLFRTWALGRKDKNNGVLLLVAPNERKVRIEVGYGLEGALTDAQSSVIVSTAMAPKFKQGDFAGGIEAAVDRIIAVLSGDADESGRRPQPLAKGGGTSDIVMLIFILFLAWIVISAVRGAMSGGARYHRKRDGSWIVLPSSGGGWGGGSFGGGSSSGGGGFSGGGGSSGGGGASGSW